MTDRIVKVVLRGEIGDLQGKLAAASKSVADTAGRMTDASKQSVKFRQGLISVGDSARNVALVAGASLGAVVAATANFDQAMSNVQAATHETAGNMDALREAAIRAGADTAFSASEAAAGIENLAKAGVSTQDILGGGLAGALDLAAAGSIDVGDAAEYAAKAMAQFSLSGDQVPHIADLFAAAAGKAVGEVGDFGQALNQTGLVASQMGLSIEDTVGSLAAFAQAGLQGSDSGTAFKSMLQRLQNPLGQGAKALEKYNINAYDAQGNFVGITSVAQQLQDKLGGLDQATRDAAMAQIFGSDAIRAATVLYSEGATGIQGWIDKVNDSGFAAETAAIKMDNLKGDLEGLKGSLETLFINTGEGQQSFFRSLTQGATDFTNSLSDLPPVVGDTAMSLLGITAVTGGAAWFGSRVIRSVASTRKALGDLNITGLNTRSVLLKSSAAMAGLAIANSDAAEKTGLSNAAAFALMGTIAGPWGAAIGGGIGLAKDFAAANNDLETSIKAAGDAIESTSRKQIKAALNDLRAELVKTLSPGSLDLKGNMGLISSYLTGGIEDSLAAIDALEYRLRQVGNATGGAASVLGSALPSSLGLTEDAFLTATSSAEDFADTLSAVNAVLSGRASLRDYQAALDAFAASVKENGKTLDITTEKGRDNQESLDAIAGTALKAAENLDGMNRVRYLQQARKDFIDAAMDLGKTRKGARGLADDLGLVDRIHAKPKADVQGAEASGKKIDNVQGKADKLDQTKSLPELLARDLASGKIDDVGRKLDVLDGTFADPTLRAVDHASATIARIRAMQIPDKEFFVRAVHTESRLGVERASGGPVYGPGTATSDSIPAWLSDGEYVVRAAAVDKYGLQMFDSINAMAFAQGGYALAAGGPVRRGIVWQAA